MLRLVLSVCVFALAACEKGTPEPTPTPTPTPTAAAEPAAATEPGDVHKVACGCSLGQKCSNMIEVDGKYVPLAGDIGLGEMAFCGKKDLEAKVSGELGDNGVFVATSFELIE